MRGASHRLVLLGLGEGSDARSGSINKDNAGDFTRPWFAWANSYFGNMILTLAETKPSLIFNA